MNFARRISLGERTPCNCMSTAFCSAVCFISSPALSAVPGVQLCRLRPHQQQWSPLSSSFAWSPVEQQRVACWLFSSFVLLLALPVLSHVPILPNNHCRSLVTLHKQESNSSVLNFLMWQCRGLPRSFCVV